MWNAVFRILVIYFLITIYLLIHKTACELDKILKWTHMDIQFIMEDVSLIREYAHLKYMKKQGVYSLIENKSKTEENC